MKKFSFKSTLIVLVLIVALASALRIYKIGENPPGLTWDEVSWGYNAYSLGIDGKDEFGRFLPITHLESFGDFKPPIYAYLDIIPIKIFGLTEFATRLPSAIFGILTVLLTFFLTKRIFYKSEKADTYGLVACFILAISPWHIMLSRAAFEANVATFFLTAGIWAFLAGIQNKSWYIVISAASFALSLYTFNTARVFAPLIVIILAIIFRKKLLGIKKQVIVAAIVGLIIFLPTFGFLLSPQAALRFKEVNIFSNIEVVKVSNQQIANDENVWWSNLMHNRRVMFAREYLIHYFDNLNPLFLFTRGDGNPKFSVQSIGQMYFWEVVFLVAGVLFLFRKREGYWWIIPIWLLLGIAPAATARETPHALRIETTLPTFQILTAYGLVSIWQILSKVKIRFKNVKAVNLYAAGIIFAAVFSLAYFLHDYYNHYPNEWSSEWQYGYKESISYVKSVESNYDRISITNNLGRPYIYYLFYGQVNPLDFRKTLKINRDPFGFVKVESFGKYNFPDNFTYKRDPNIKTLYIGTASELPDGATLLRTFNLLNGNPVLIAYE